MMEQAHRTPSPALVEHYRQQMMALYGQQEPPAPTEDNWLESRFPEPDIQRDRAAVALPEEPDTPQSPPIAETLYVGYLRVFVFTGDKAEPVANALVTVSKEGTLFANTVTDRDGYTQVIPLPSVDPALTLTPGVATPYVAYDILTTADGFHPVRHERVPVYGNNYVTQPVALLPIVPGEDPEQMQDFVSGGPTNL